MTEDDDMPLYTKQEWQGLVWDRPCYKCKSLLCNGLCKEEYGMPKQS